MSSDCGGPADGPPRVLGVFAKLPQPGKAKTRLAAETSAEWAAQVAEAFLADTLERVAQVPASRTLAFAPRSARGYFERLAGVNFCCVPQGEGDLGRRVHRFFAGAEYNGPAVLLGTDSPTLPLALIEQAFQALENHQVVLGPATDGGYYLVGCSRPVPGLFDHIRWSSSQVLSDTVARLADRTEKLALLPPWYDIDTLEDWWMLQGHLRALRRAGIDPGVPRTELLCHSPVPWDRPGG